MNEQTNAVIREKRRGVIIDELLALTASIGAAVPVGAIGEPKIPTFVGD